jgi:alpha-ketoglutarate-dependent taurine dioxygenase
MTQGESDLQQARLEAALARAQTSHMSNAKWRALFHLLHEVGVTQLRWKVVRDERNYLAPPPPAVSLLADRFGDVLPSPYAAYRELEWIEVAAPDDALVARLTSARKQFPWRGADSGWRVVGYTW